MEVTIREAKTTDAYDIAYVNVYTWKSTYGDLIDNYLIDKRINNILFRTEKLREVLGVKNNFLVAEIDGSIVGYITYGKSRMEKYKDSGEIGALYILSEYQNKGIGKKLLKEAVIKLQENGFNSMIICSLKGNKARYFYELMGGIVVDSKTDTIDNVPLVEDVIYYESFEKILNENKSCKI